MKKFPWTITIDSVANGVIVKVGCTRLVYMEDAFGLLINDLDLYIKDYKEAEKLIYERWGLKFGGDAEQPVEPTAPRYATSRVTCEKSPEPPDAPEEATEGQDLTAGEENLRDETAKEEKRARR